MSYKLYKKYHIDKKMSHHFKCYKKFILKLQDQNSKRYESIFYNGYGRKHVLIDNGYLTRPN